MVLHTFIDQSSLAAGGLHSAESSKESTIPKKTATTGGFFSPVARANRSTQ
jgi:hypothetical protein